MAFGTFGDLINSSAYTPKSAPKRERKNNFPYTERRAFENGIHYLRPLSHPQHLPKGFHVYTMHKIPKKFLPRTASKAERDANFVRVLCTESYAPSQPCYLCLLVKDYDKAGLLDPKVIGQQNFDIMVRFATAFCRSIVIPMLIKGVVGTKMNKGRDGKEYENVCITPHLTTVSEISLWLKPNHPDRGGDTTFFNKLTLLGMTREQINAKTQLLASQQHMSQEHKVQYDHWCEMTNHGQKFTNPHFHDPQHGNWIAYNKQKMSQHLDLTQPQPEPLPYDLVTKYYADKVYPTPETWGQNDTDYKESAALGWYATISALRDSDLGRDLENVHGQDLNLTPEELGWEGPAAQAQQPQAPQQAYQPAAPQIQVVQAPAPTWQQPATQTPQMQYPPVQYGGVGQSIQHQYQPQQLQFPQFQLPDTF